MFWFNGTPLKSARFVARNPWCAVDHKCVHDLKASLVPLFFFVPFVLKLLFLKLEAPGENRGLQAQRAKYSDVRRRYQFAGYSTVTDLARFRG
jgi:hypothetical protein